MAAPTRTPSACEAKRIAIRYARSASTTGSSSATWIDSPSSSAAHVTANSVESTSSISPGVDAVLDDPDDQVAPALVQLDPVLAHLGVAERLGPQVEPQTPVEPVTSSVVGHARHCDQALEPVAHAGVAVSICSAAA